MQGYGPVDEWLFFRHVGETLRPDIVLIVAFVGNDAVEANDKEAWLDAGRRAEPRRRSTPPPRRMRRLTRSSMVLQLARVRVDQLRSRLTGPGTERPLTTYLAESAARSRARAGGDAAGLWSDRGTGVDHGRAFGARAHAGPISDRRRGLRAAGGDGAVPAAASSFVTPATERFRTALAPLGLPMLDLLPVLERQPDRAGLFFQRNVHLTPRGHDVVADGAVRVLRGSQRLSADPPARRP